MPRPVCLGWCSKRELEGRAACLGWPSFAVNAKAGQVFIEVILLTSQTGFTSFSLSLWNSEKLSVFRVNDGDLVMMVPGALSSSRNQDIYLITLISFLLAPKLKLFGVKMVNSSYDGTVEAHTPNGYYVCYDVWGNKEEVDPDNVGAIHEEAVNALLEAEKVAEATKEALKRKIAQAAVADFQSPSLSAKLRIQPDDPEDVIASC